MVFRSCSPLSFLLSLSLAIDMSSTTTTSATLVTFPSSPAPCFQRSLSPLKYSNRALDNRSSEMLLQLPSHSASLRRVASATDTQTIYKAATRQSLSFPGNSNGAPPERSQSTNSVVAQRRQQRSNAKVSISNFTKIKLLGKGDVGKVYLVKHNETSKLYALKGIKFEYVGC